MNRKERRIYPRANDHRTFERVIRRNPHPAPQVASSAENAVVSPVVSLSTIHPHAQSNSPTNDTRLLCSCTLVETPKRKAQPTPSPSNHTLWTQKSDVHRAIDIVTISGVVLFADDGTMLDAMIVREIPFRTSSAVRKSGIPLTTSYT